MAIFKSAEVRDCYPVVLVLLIWVRWSHSRLCCEGELSYCIGGHLLWIPVLKGEDIRLLDLLKRLLILDTFILAPHHIGGRLLELLDIILNRGTNY